MNEDILKYQRENKLLIEQNQMLAERIQKYTLLNDLISEMLKVSDLEDIFKMIVNTLQKHTPNTIILLNSINEIEKESRLIEIAGMSSSLLQKALSIIGFNPLGKVYELIPEHNDYCRTGKLVEFKGGLAEFSASELSPMVARAIERLLNLKQIFTIGIIKDEHLLATIHLFKFSTTKPLDHNFIETLVKQAGQIIQRKIIEKELKESELRFKALHNASFGGIAIHDNGLILDCNHGLSEMSGYSKNELIGLNGLFLISEATRHIARSHIVAGSSDTYEVVGVRKDGTEFPVRLQGRNIPYKGRDVRSVEFRDITAEKKNEIELLAAKEKAEESDRLKTAFLANMSHEIRTPMNGILGFAALLKNQNLTGEEKLEYFNIIEKSGERMLNIINDLINISKVESGMIELSYSRVNVKEQLDYLMAFFLPEATQKGLEFSLDYSLSEKDSELDTDPEKLYAILSNLIKNALKFTKKGSIVVGCYCTASSYEFYVKDTGVGIPKNKLDLIFERFVQADENLARGYEGAGLGLSISKAYSEMLGGTLKVESEPGIGTCFTFSLPKNTGIEITPQPHSGILPEQYQSTIKQTVLIVEDDIASLKLLGKILQDFNFNLLTAQTGNEAIEICRIHEDIKLILMDIKLPDLDGYTAAKMIREFRPNLPVIAQTAFALSTDNKRFGPVFNAYVTKPIQAEVLKEKILLFLK